MPRFSAICTFPSAADADSAVNPVTIYEGGTGVEVGVGVEVDVAVGVEVGEGVEVAVGVGDAVDVAVAVGVGIRVAVAIGDGVAVGCSEAVPCGVGMSTGEVAGALQTTTTNAANNATRAPATTTAIGLRLAAILGRPSRLICVVR